LTRRPGGRGTEAMENSQPGPAVSGVVVTTSHIRWLAVAAYLARFKGQSRIHTESDLRGYLNWCEWRGLDPLAATRPHIELYVRWLQEVRRHRPSTVSRRMSVVAGFYPNLRHRRRARALTGRVRPAPQRAGRIADAGTDPPAVRGPAHRRQGVNEPLRLRTGRDARAARAPHLRGHRERHRGPR
jgi:hypothetical protein